MFVISAKVVKPKHTGDTPTYLQPNKNTMQKPIEGLPALALFTLFIVYIRGL
jgi:hypothetical protein